MSGWNLQQCHQRKSSFSCKADQRAGKDVPSNDRKKNVVLWSSLWRRWWWKSILNLDFPSSYSYYTSYSSSNSAYPSDKTSAYKSTLPPSAMWSNLPPSALWEEAESWLKWSTASNRQHCRWRNLTSLEKLLFFQFKWGKKSWDGFQFCIVHKK